MKAPRRTLVSAALLLALMGGGASVALGHHPGGHRTGQDERLPSIGRAPDFALTDQEGRRVRLADLRGKVVVVTFVFTTCTDMCPVLTAKLVSLQPRLGRALGDRVAFVAITVDAERDTPDALKRYAEHHGADAAGWSFLTGTPEQIRAVARRYGVYQRRHGPGDIDHSFLTSLVDPSGTLRVQYMGVRFDLDEFLHDLRSLMDEPAPS